MAINISNALNSRYPKDQVAELKDKPQSKAVKTQEASTTDGDETVQLTDEARALQLLHEEIAKLPKSDDEKVQQVREKFLKGELGIMQSESEAVKTYNRIADKLLSIDELF